MVRGMQKLITKITQEPTIYMLRKMWRFSAGNRRSVVAFMIMYVCANAIGLFTPLIFAMFINEIQLHGVTDANVWKLSLIISLPILTMLLFWLFHGFGRILEQKNATLAEIHYRSYFLAGTLALGMQWHNDRDSGDTIDKINKATSSLFTFSDQIYEVFKIVFGITGAVFVLFFFNAYIAVGVFFAIIVALYLMSRFDAVLVERYKLLNTFENKISAGIFDTISNVTTVLILNIQEAVIKRLRKLLFAPVEKTVQHAKINEMKWFSGSVMFECIVIVPIVFYLFYELAHDRVILVGTVTALYMYLERMSGSFFSFTSTYESIMYGKARVENAKEIERAIEENAEKKQKNSVGAWNTLRIDGLTFAYDAVAADAFKHLDNIDLTITRGERIACIGESGSGKTTFLKILHGLYDSAHAQIRFDDGEHMLTNFADIALETMLVPQEPEVFSSTVKENITLGLGYSKEEVSNVIDMAQFTDVVAQLPKGLRSVINEKGVNLSGGQKQRLALARAILFAREKEIILLDESTSSVDPENEALIYKKLLAAFEGKTILASIHKMNLLKYFDRILIFENGKIVDDGTFDELMERNESFQKSWQEFIDKEKK